MEKGEIEVLLCRKEGKIHESIFITDITPVEFHALLLCIGLQPASDSLLQFDHEGFIKFLNTNIHRTQKEALIWIFWEDQSGESHKIRGESLLISRSTKMPLKNKSWFFNGIKIGNRGIHSGYWLSLIGTLYDSYAVMNLAEPEAWHNHLLCMNESFNLETGQQVFLTIERKKKKI